MPFSQGHVAKCVCFLRVHTEHLPLGWGGLNFALTMAWISPPGRSGSIYLYLSSFPYFSFFFFLAQKWREAPRKENVRDAGCQAFMLLSADLTSLFLGLSRDSYSQDELWVLQIELDWTDHVASSGGMAQGVLLRFPRSRGKLELLTQAFTDRIFSVLETNKQTNKLL